MILHGPFVAHSSRIVNLLGRCQRIPSNGEQSWRRIDQELMSCWATLRTKSCPGIPEKKQHSYFKICSCIARADLKNKAFSADRVPTFKIRSYNARSDLINKSSRFSGTSCDYFATKSVYKVRLAISWPEVGHGLPTFGEDNRPRVESCFWSRTRRVEGRDLGWASIVCKIGHIWDCKDDGREGCGNLTWTSGWDDFI